MSNEITRFRGDTYPDVLEVKADGTALDISGHSFVLTISEFQFPGTGDNNLYQITGSIENASAGIVHFSPTDIQADQEPKRFFYDIQMIDQSGAKRTIKKDIYTYMQDITK
jgi:hypothetical protein|tara:strand:+ start:532 stop:864 length:333 start_codon:yes stop_codon:yes gene_type:complete